MSGKGDKRRKGENTARIRANWPFSSKHDIPEVGSGYPPCCQQCHNCPKNSGSGVCNNCTKNVKE